MFLFLSNFNCFNRRNNLFLQIQFSVGITLGCKQSQACKTNQSMNFHGQFEHQYQVFINYYLQKISGSSFILCQVCVNNQSYNYWRNERLRVKINLSSVNTI